MMHPLPDELESRLREHVEAVGLGRLWPELREVARPALLVELVPDGDIETLGKSRFGGVPDLPVGWEWPEGEDGLLTFIGQIDCSELPALPVPLPDRGLLTFFLGIDEPATNVSNEVLYQEEPGELRRLAEPDESEFENDECPLFDPVAVRFERSVSLPDDIPSEFESDEDKLYQLRELPENPRAPRQHSQLLGHPLGIAGDPRADAYLVSQGRDNILYSRHRQPEDLEKDIDAASAESDGDRVEHLLAMQESLRWYHGDPEAHQREIDHWQLLLEVSSHRECGMSWWDAGRLQFLVDGRRLEAGDYSKVYACIQSS